MGMISQLKYAARRRLWKKVSADPQAGARQIRRACESMIEQAGEDIEAGQSLSRTLYAFETAYEEISDSVWSLRERGETQQCLEIMAMLYEFTQTSMAGRGMLVSVFIAYRYADLLRECERPEESMALYRKLMEQLDGMIGCENVYTINCLEGYARSALAAGADEEAEKAMDSMYRTAAAMEGTDSLLARAVQKRTQVIRKSFTAAGEETVDLTSR